MSIFIFLLSLSLWTSAQATEIIPTPVVKISNPTLNGKKLSVAKYCFFYDTYDSDGDPRTERTCVWRSQQAVHICRFLGLGSPAPGSFLVNAGTRDSDWGTSFGVKVPAVEISCESQVSKPPGANWASRIYGSCIGELPASIETESDQWFIEIACYQK